MKYALIPTQFCLHLWADQKAIDGKVQHELDQLKLATDEEEKVYLGAESKTCDIAKEMVCVNECTYDNYIT
jgi:hypothetical protein